MNKLQGIDLRKLNLTDSQLDALIETRPLNHKIGDGSPRADSEKLRGILEEVFVSSHEVRYVLRELIDYMTSGLERILSDEKTYLRRFYADECWDGVEFPAVVFTGLPGTGKTQLKKALCRVLASAFDDEFVRKVSGHRGLPFCPLWPISLTRGASLASMLLSFLDMGKGNEVPDDAQAIEGRVNPKKKTGATNTVLSATARAQSWRDATALIWVDEFQSVSFGRDSNAKAAGILSQLMAIGPRLVFTVNYSLGWALKERPGQDTDRIISCPLSLEPEVQGSKHSIDLLKAYLAAVPGLFGFEIADGEPLVHKFSFGINRYKKYLIVGAYQIAREDGRHAIELGDLEAAFIGMGQQRERVDTLWRQEITGTMIDRDLCSPFESATRRRKAEGEKVSELKSACEAFETRVEEDLLLDSLLPQQAAALEQLSSKERVKTQPPGKVVRLRQKRATKDDLLEGLSDF